MPHLTLASINARLSESPSSTTAYPKSWMPDYAFDQRGAPLQPQEFQSNSVFDPHLPFDADTPLGRAGLGIHYPEHPNDLKTAFTPNAFFQETTNDSFLSFSPRLDVSYSSSGLTFGDPNSSLDGSLNSSWSLSMIFGELRQGSDTSSSAILENNMDGINIEFVPGEDFSLEALSAAAGLSVEEFTNRITDGAKYALEQAASVTASLPGQDPAALLDAQPFPGLPALGIADSWLPQIPPGAGINPADIMPAPLLSAGTSLDEMFGILGNGMHLEDPVVQYHRLPELRYPSTPPMPHMVLELPRIPRPSTPSQAQREDGDQLSDYEPPPFMSPSSSEYSPSMGSSRQYQTRASRIRKRKIPLCDTTDTNNPISVPGPSADPLATLPPIDLGSPVFDAHRGIDIEDLKARAERYRLRNQGREYDKRWLLSYAGKLSSKGELLEEFRCYITGCTQVNKRRDHILIHVGAHLDQRPFKCVHCCARFLRKNECKRHELSHTGIRPFTCHLCPFPATTFVRQDLLRRHMKRTHQMDDDKENKASSSRPRKKIRKF
ncbi:hypothetical protein D9611_007642 [Ephemerocybe angulata]|uniref:C2H2-type domain-containing protein n=1 Tax=Ephemerocybe angulata TaxID=980116 RepID=A0A8H5BYU2_9AGAR|nr:hypothetical protein D9611_007642 [Tulosesus angulatus]